MNEESEFDPANRHLCPDGTCTGLVGADGRCAVCGRDGGPAPVRGAVTVAVEAMAGDLPAKDVETGLSAGGEAGPAGFDTSRRLCEDGSCVGVVGTDGRCGVCGRAVASS